MNMKPFQILLVEDNPADVRLAREALKGGPVENNLNVVPDGIEAVAYLRREGNYAGVSRPELILLDLNLPKKDGREVLAQIKADDDLKTIPVIVLTTSSADQDIQTAYRLHANCYVVKQLDLDAYISSVRSIENFWFRTAKLPRIEDHEQ